MKRHVNRAIAVLALTMTIAPALADDHDHKHEHADEHSQGQKKVESHDHDHDHEEASSKFGAGKAIEAVKEEGKRFKLSVKAQTTMGVTLLAAEQIKPNVFKVPRHALVHYQDETGVYVQHDGWFAIIPVKAGEATTTHVTVTTSGVRQGDQIAVTGVPFLRIAHLEAMGQGGQGHVH